MRLEELSSKKEIDGYQDRELVSLLHYLSGNSPFYREHFKKHGIDLSKIQSVKDLNKIPPVTKNELQQRNFDFLCVDKKDVVEYCTTSGTLGKPVTIALTEKDLLRLAKNEYQSYVCAGMTSDDIVLLMLSLDRMFMAGIAYYLGARDLGAGIIRGGPGNFAMQLETIHRLQPTVLIAVPSFIVGLADYAAEQKIDLNATPVKKIICIGENIRDETFKLNPLGERIRKTWKVDLFSTYASTEQQTAFTECEHGNGGHQHPELLIFEVLDDDGNPLPAGEYGELVITTLGVEGMPLLRYKTGDICAYYDAPCACGRHTARISPIAGRKQQLIKYKGTTLYPQALFNILNAMEGVQDYAISLRKNELEGDDLMIHIALTDNSQLTGSAIRQTLQSLLRVVPEISFPGLAAIQKMQVIEGKRKIYKLIDMR